MERRGGVDVVVLDALREARSPFSPDQTVEDFSTLLGQYRVTKVCGDRYAGEWPRERLRAHGVNYEPAVKIRSDLDRDLLPRLNAGTVELPDQPTLLAQLVGLERRVARSGRETIDRGPNGRDDVANAVAGVVDLAGQPKPYHQIFL